MDRNIDEIFMEEAIKLALEAAERDEALKELKYSNPPCEAKKADERF